MNSDLSCRGALFDQGVGARVPNRGASGADREAEGAIIVPSRIPRPQPVQPSGHRKELSREGAGSENQNGEWPENTKNRIQLRHLYQNIVRLRSDSDRTYPLDQFFAFFQHCYSEFPIQTEIVDRSQKEQAELATHLIHRISQSPPEIYTFLSEYLKPEPVLGEVHFGPYEETEEKPLFPEYFERMKSDGNQAQRRKYWSVLKTRDDS